MKGIMYHYVRPETDSLPFLNYLHVEDFEKQLNYFGNEFGFVSKSDLKISLETGQPTSGVLLTFDDGLSCHYDHVFPILKKYGLWGIFYIPTQVFEKKKVLDVHRIHILLARIAPHVLYENLLQIIEEKYLEDSFRPGFYDLTYSSQKNDDHTNSIKRILNYFISYRYRETVIDRLFELFIPENVTTEDYYLSIDDMEEMADCMVIGSHTVSHSVMSKLSLKIQEDEIKNSFAFLERENLISEFRTFCYPYGGFHTFTESTEQLLDQSQCEFSFNVEPRDIETHDLTFRKQALPRYDCNQFPFGQVRTKYWK